MELSVVTLWSAFSPIHAELVRYLHAETFPVPTRFVWVVNTTNPATHRMLAEAGPLLKERGYALDVIRCDDHPGAGVVGKHQHVAHLYNQVLPTLVTPHVLFLEDDNLPSAGAYAHAAAALELHGHCGALSALYRSRTNPEWACAALATDRWDKVLLYAKAPRVPIYVGFVGGGFTLYRLAALKAGIPFHAEMVGDRIHGWDANLCLQMRAHGWDIILHGGLRIGHHCPEVLAWCARTGESIF